MKRAEIWWAELPAPVGSRPAVILTRDAVLHSIDGIVVGLVTRTVRGVPSEVVLGRKQGLLRGKSSIERRMVPTIEPKGVHRRLDEGFPER